MGTPRESLGARHPEVRRLRALLRDRAARATEQAIVLEGPRLLDGALDRAAPVRRVYLGDRADAAFASLVARVEAAGIECVTLKEGVLERLGTTRTPQPVLALADAPPRRAIGELGGAGCVLVAASVADPGNLGTLLRSAEAAGVTGVVCCGNSVDVGNPKVVRSSAGAVFGVPIVEEDDPVQVLDALGAQGRRRLGTVARDGEPYDRVDLAAPVAIVLGNEAHGLPSEVRDLLDGALTIPMAGDAESLNVAVAGSVLAFESARQRAARA